MDSVSAHDRISHRLRPDGRVVLTAHYANGRYDEEVHVLGGEAKRLAWALLADLDPEEAVACGLADEIELFRAAPRLPTEPTPRKLLTALGIEARGLKALLAQARVDKAAATQWLANLQRNGLVLRLEEAGALGRDGVYVATPLARELLRREAAHG